MRQKLTSGLLLVAVLAGLALPGAALASKSGRRNTAIGLSGLAAYQLLHGHTTTGALAAGGALYAWKRTSDASKAERRRARLARSYRSRSRYSRARYRHR
jgi:hypothetical protein